MKNQNNQTQKYTKTITNYLTEIDNNFCNLTFETFDKKIINTIIPSLQKLGCKLSIKEKAINNVIISSLLGLTIDYDTQYNKIESVQKTLQNLYNSLELI